MTQISRRTVTRGVAWSAPAVAMTAAAPAVAASSTPSVGATQFTSAYGTRAPNSPCVSQGLVGYEMMAQERYGDELVFAGASDPASVTSVTFTFFYAKPSLTFTAGADDSGCWSIPTRTGETRTYNGVTYYAYATTLQCASGTCFTGDPAADTVSLNVAACGFDFVSSCFSPGPSSERYFSYRVDAVVEGQPVMRQPGFGYMA